MQNFEFKSEDKRESIEFDSTSNYKWLKKRLVLVNFYSQARNYDYRLELLHLSKKVRMSL